MEPNVKKDILSTIKSAVKILKKRDVIELDLLSNKTIHNASIYQDKDSISVAIIIYALSKIVKRVEHHEIHNWEKTSKIILESLEKSISYLEKDNEKAFRLEIKTILKKVGEIDRKLKWYIEDVLDKSRIVKGAKLYEHGLSLGKAASLLGVSQYELMGYIGKTQIADVFPEEGVPLKKRLAYAKKLFKV